MLTKSPPMRFGQINRIRFYITSIRDENNDELFVFANVLFTSERSIYRDYRLIGNSIRRDDETLLLVDTLSVISVPSSVQDKNCLHMINSDLFYLFEF